MRFGPLRSHARTRALLLLAGAAIASLLVGAGAADSARSARNGKFAFAGNFESLWVMNANGAARSQLTRHIASDNLPGLIDTEPDWSPNGTMIVFSRSRQSAKETEPTSEIWVMNANGSNQTRLTRAKTNDYGPVWSPDGKKIAFVRDASREHRGTRGSGEIYVMKANGTGATRLTTSTFDPASGHGTSTTQPSWSPDGARIAYTSQATEDPYKDGVYVMNADGSGQTRLTTLEADAARPDWSPVGAKIAFESEDLDIPYTQRGNVFEVYVMNGDGSGQTKLTNNDGSCPYGCPNNEVHTQPAWSPDGTRLAFTRFIPSKNIDQRDLSDIFLMSPDGSAKTMIARYVHYGVDWGPIATGRPNPLPAPPPSSPQPELKLRCRNHVLAVKGRVFEALVTPSAGVRSVSFFLDGRYVTQASIPPLFVRFPVSDLPKHTWTVKAVVTVVANEAQTAWVKRVLTKRHAPNC